MGPGAKILKNGAPLPAARIPAEVHEAARRVRETIAAAERRGRELVARAEAERAAVLAEAEVRGLSEGRARAGALLAAAAAARDRRLAEAEREVAELALEVARRVLGAELAHRPAAVVDLAARAVAAARERRDVTLRIHPDDAAVVSAAHGRLAALLARAPLAIREDAAVPRGGAVVETEAGRADGSVDAQLSELARALDEELG